MSDFEVLFPIPDNRRNSDDMGMPSPVAKMSTLYPETLCADCGNKYGRIPCGEATWHMGKCGICDRLTAVTEPRDFGHLKEGWRRKDHG